MPRYTNRGYKYFEILFSVFSFHIPKNSYILEIGCGEGLLVKEFIKLGHMCTCINNLEYGKKNILVKQINSSSNNLNFINVNYLNGLPFKNDTFDLITSVHAFNEGKMDPYKVNYVMSEVSRVMKKDGTALIHLFQEKIEKGVLYVYKIEKHIGTVWSTGEDVVMKLDPYTDHDWKKSRNYVKKWWSVLTNKKIV